MNHFGPDLQIDAGIGVNGSPLLHRTVTLANRVPRSELSGILTFGGVIVTSNFGAALWRARVSQIRPAASMVTSPNPELSSTVNRTANRMFCIVGYLRRSAIRSGRSGVTKTEQAAHMHGGQRRGG